MCVNACGICKCNNKYVKKVCVLCIVSGKKNHTLLTCPLSQGRVSMRMMCVLISLLHQISTILSVTKNVGVLSCVAILVLFTRF